MAFAVGLIRWVLLWPSIWVLVPIAAAVVAAIWVYLDPRTWFRRKASFALAAAVGIGGLLSFTGEVEWAEGTAKIVFGGAQGFSIALLVLTAWLVWLDFKQVQPNQESLVKGDQPLTNYGTINNYGTIQVGNSFAPEASEALSDSATPQATTSGLGIDQIDLSLAIERGVSKEKVAQAQKHLKAGNHDEASTILQDIEATCWGHLGQADKSTVARTRGLLALLAEKPEEAGPHFIRAAEFAPENEKAAALGALGHFLCGDRKKAFDTARDVMDKYPSAALALL